MTIPPNMLQKRSEDGRQKVYFGGREAYLAGIYPDVQTLDGVNGDRSSLAAGNVDFRPSMERLARHTNNFFRHWVLFYPLMVNYNNIKQPLPGAAQDCSEKTESVTSAGEPWRKRYSPFFYTPGKKWDLNRYNDDYFLRLRKMIETAYDYGLVVQLMIFDRTGLDFMGDCLRWPYNPWNAKNNINKVIDAPNNGVNKFYDRSQVGQIIVRNPGRPGDGDPPISVEEITLGELQDNYANRVVSATVEYPNVVYEIMNEPIHNPGGRTDEEKLRESLIRATWADAIVGAVYGLTQGRRFIFYNDHTFAGQTGSQVRLRGQDIINWQKTPSLKNFVHLDGVIFHSDVKTFDPEKLEAVVKQNLIVQVSTDANPDSLKENPDYNLATANNAFNHDMMFQAETAKEENAAAIGNAGPPPTLFKLPPFVSTWVKIGENPATNIPHVVYVQNADGTLYNLNPDKDVINMRGRVIQLDAWKIVYWNELTKSSGTYSYQFRNTFSQLVLTRDGHTQIFLRYQGPLVRFVAQWERISQNPATQVQNYYFFIYPDNTFVTHRISDFQVNNRGRITNVTPRQISFHSDMLNTDTTWNYSFTNQGQQLTLEKDDHSWTQVFRRA